MPTDIEETYDGLRITSELLDCSFPVALDTYSKCAFGCLYCFAAFQKELCHSGACTYARPLRCVNTERIKRIVRGEISSGYRIWFSEKRPIQWGAMADQFDLYEKKYGKTLELMRFFSGLDYPISFSTKGAWVFSDERYLELFRAQRGNWHIKMSVITLDEAAAAKVERGVPSPLERLAAMRSAADCGCAVTLRFRPFVLGVSDRGLEDLIARAADAGAYSVSTEFLCIDARNVLHPGSQSARNFETLSRVAGRDLVAFYRTHSERKNGLMRLSCGEKMPVLERIHRLCDRYGLAFFCSDACGKAQSAHCCCCGAPPGFGYSRGNFSEALQIARVRGEVHWRDISADMRHLTVPLGKVNYHCTASTVTRHRMAGFTLADYMHRCWNTPESLLSPAKMYSDFLVASGFDDAGDVVYRRRY